MATAQWISSGELSGTYTAGTMDYFWSTPQSALIFDRAATYQNAGSDDGTTWMGTWTAPAQDEVDRYPFLQEMVIQVTPNGDMVIKERPAPEEFPDPIDDNAVDKFIAGGDS